MLVFSAVCDLSQLLSTDRHADRLIQEARKLLTDESAPKRRKLLGEFLRHLQDNSELEKREDDEGWFKGRPSHGGCFKRQSGNICLFTHL